MYFARVCFVLLLLKKESSYSNLQPEDFKKFVIADNPLTLMLNRSDVCFVPMSCSPDFRYRPIDGTCNNLCNPPSGSANTPFKRILPATFGDGVHSPPKSKDGSDLPKARIVRKEAFPEGEILDEQFSVFVMQYGQGIAHDIVGTLNTTDQPSCPNKTPNDIWMPIEIPENDARFQKCDLPCTETCMEYARSITSPCAITKEKQIQNFVTSYPDLSYVYGSIEILSKLLRLFQGGLLRYQMIDGYMYLPTGTSCLYCNETRKANYCFLAGDLRVNQHPMLVALQTLYLREHNRIAKILAELNPLWIDETLFQEARKIAIAIHQVITCRDWLPIILGDETMTKYDLYPTVDDSNDCYKCDIDAGTMLAFNVGCFRYFHTLVRSDILYYSSATKMEGSDKLSDTFLLPDTAVCKFDQVIQGMVYASMQKADTKNTNETTEKMFKSCEKCGLDLISMDIQRHSDYGVPSYNDIREFCGFKRASCFEDFEDLITCTTNIGKLKSLYNHPDDVQLLVGSSLENHNGGLTGPTCKCIMALQFKNYKCGDRYFFPKYFSVEKATEIYKYTLSHLICNNGNNIDAIPKDSFRLPSSSNPLVNCSCLPQPNWEVFKELVPSFF